MHILLLTGALLASQMPDTVPQLPAPRSFTFYAENDVLAFGLKDKTDRFYTNGVQAVWTRFSLPGWMKQVSDHGLWPSRACRLLADLPRTSSCGFYTVGIGQTMHTPDTLGHEGPIYEDRPFAGWTYALGSMGIVRWPHVITIEGQLGVIGPLAGAEHTQAMAHWFWAPTAIVPRGWDHQLRNQVGANATIRYSYTRETGIDLPGIGRLNFEASPRLRVQHGTVLRATRAGLRARLGKNMPREFAHGRIPVAGPRAGSFWFALLGELEGRAVYHNTFLEGGYGDDEPDEWGQNERIDAELWGHDLIGGIALGAKGFVIGHQWVRRSPEFRPPGIDGEPHWFGIFTVSVGTIR